MQKSSIFLVILLISIISNSKAQTLTSNPYSYYGLGILENNGFCENSGAGSAGIAMPSEGYMNQLNPASYHALDSAAFYFYIGASGRFAKFEYSGKNQKDFESNLKYVALGFKVNKWWGTSLGIVPFSSRGYYVTSTHPVEGDLSSYILVSEGSGNITKCYFSNSFKITKNLAIGANLSYLFGSLKNEEQLVYSDESFDDVSNLTTNFFNNVVIDFGIQYKMKIGDNNYYAGITYNPKQDLNTSFEETVTYGSDTLYSEDEGTETFTIPSSIGLGLGATFNDKLKVMVDYKSMQWSQSNYTYNSVKLSDSWQINAGAEYTNNTKSGRSYWDFVSFRLGFRYEKTYLKVNGKNLNDIAFSTGITMPIKYNRSVISIAYEYGLMGTNYNGLIHEKYNRIILGVSLSDRWFQKRKFY